MKPADLFNFNRSVADRLAAVLAKTPLKPNHITTLSLACGAAAAWSVSRGSLAGMLGGAALIHLRFILDNCDGKVARIKGLSSRLGMWYDFIADVTADLFLWVGLAFGSRALGYGDSAFLICAAACAGSLIQFAFVVTERLGRVRAAEADPSRRHELLSVLYALNHDGDPSLLVWVAAPLAGPFWFLVLGAVYMQVIWLSSALFSRSALWRL